MHTYLLQLFRTEFSHGHSTHLFSDLGDSADTAAAVGRQVGLFSSPIINNGCAALDIERVINTPDFMSWPEELQVAELKQPGNMVFSRAKPLDKLHLVNLLRSNCSEVVAMTGDGVNDASALHKVRVSVPLIIHLLLIC